MDIVRSWLSPNDLEFGFWLENINQAKLWPVQNIFETKKERFKRVWGYSSAIPTWSFLHGNLHQLFCTSCLETFQFLSIWLQSSHILTMSCQLYNYIFFKHRGDFFICIILLDNKGSSSSPCKARLISGVHILPRTFSQGARILLQNCAGEGKIG